MKKIKLTQGKFALVDDIDFAYLNQWKWTLTSNNGNKLYAARYIRNPKRTVLMHRIILSCKLCGSKFKQTDHVNGNGLDNRRRNLRPATVSENQSNRGCPSHNKSQYKGVCWNSRDKRWLAYIVILGKHKYLGQFKTKIQAAQAYNKAAKKYFGKFARLNKI